MNQWPGQDGGVLGWQVRIQRRSGECRFIPYWYSVEEYMPGGGGGTLPGGAEVPSGGAVLGGASAGTAGAGGGRRGGRWQA